MFAMPAPVAPVASVAVALFDPSSSDDVSSGGRPSSDIVLPRRTVMNVTVGTRHASLKYATNDEPGAVVVVLPSSAVVVVASPSGAVVVVVSPSLISFTTHDATAFSRDDDDDDDVLAPSSIVVVVVVNVRFVQYAQRDVDVEEVEQLAESDALTTSSSVGD